MELGKSHTVCILNDKRVAVRNINTGFDKSCADEHIYLTLDKPSPYIEQLLLAHSAVRYADIGIRHHRMNIGGAGIYTFYAVMNIIYLTVSAQLLANRLCYYSPVVLYHIGCYRVAVAGRSFNDTHIAYSGHCHIERSRNRGCG